MIVTSTTCYPFPAQYLRADTDRSSVSRSEILTGAEVRAYALDTRKIFLKIFHPTETYLSSYFELDWAA